jgi:hypothetical protein
MIISVLSTSLDDFNGSVFDHEMFDGCSDPREYVRDEFSMYGYSTPIGRMQVRQRYGAIPDIFSLDAHLVVDESIAGDLAKVPYVRLDEVEFVSLVNLPLNLDYDKARRLCKKAKVKLVTSSDVFKALPNQLKPDDILPRYFEVKAPVLDRVLTLEEMIPSDVYSSMRAWIPRYREHIAKYVDASIFEEYPMLFSGGGYLMQPAVLDMLRPHLVLPYFSLFEMEFRRGCGVPQKLRTPSAG